MSIKNTLKQIFEKERLKDIGKIVGEWILSLGFGVLVIYSLKYLGVDDMLKIGTDNTISPDEAHNIALNTCSIMGETRKIESRFRVQAMIDAREKIGGAPFVEGDEAIIESFKYGLCEELVLGGPYYADLLQYKKEIEEEEERIADSKPTVEETYYDNGQIKTLVNYQPKSEGGLKHGISEKYYENGSLYKRYTFQNGKRHGPYERYFENGKLEVKTNYENDKLHGPYERYSKYSSKRLELKTNFKNGRLHGSHEIYWEDGSLNAKTTFEDGIDIGPCIGRAALCRQAQNFFIIEDYIFLKD